VRLVKFGAGMVGALIILLAAHPVSAYRPFVSTDASVEDPAELEIELGGLTLDRTGHENTFTTPSVVVNYGVRERWELVGQFSVQEGLGTEITGPGVFLKGVLKEGSFRTKTGLAWRWRRGHCCRRP
jgi:hypothetical protein